MPSSNSCLIIKSPWIEWHVSYSAWLLESSNNPQVHSIKMLGLIVWQKINGVRLGNASGRLARIMV